MGDHKGCGIRSRHCDVTYKSQKARVLGKAQTQSGRVGWAVVEHGGAVSFGAVL